MPIYPALKCNFTAFSADSCLFVLENTVKIIVFKFTFQCQERNIDLKFHDFPVFGGFIAQACSLVGGVWLCSSSLHHLKRKADRIAIVKSRDLSTFWPTEETLETFYNNSRMCYKLGDASFRLLFEIAIEES